MVLGDRVILRSPFWIEMRGLAVLRISVALIVLADLASRAPALGAFYTDEGVLPRDAVAFHAQLPSVYWWAGSLAQAAALFVLTAACAVALLLGFWTRLATFATWALVLSLHNRNPAVHQAGDSVLCLLLFWLLLLPAGARFSLDARRSPPAPATCHAPGLLVQFVLIFFCTVDFKLMGDSWRSGYAVRETLGVSFYARPLAHALLAYPRLLTATGWMTIAGEAFIVAAILCLWRQPFFRGAAVCVTLATQIAFSLFLKLGIFPWVMSAYALSLAPGWLWDRFWPDAQAPREPARTPWLARIATAVALSLVLLWNLGEAGATYGAGTPLNESWPGRLASLIGLRQRWAMFAPNVQTEDGQFAVVALEPPGVDVLPQMVGQPLAGNTRWTLLFLDLLQAPSPALLRGIGRYGCEVANREGVHDFVAVRLTHFEHLRDGGITEPESSELLRERCVHPFAIRHQ
jgi:hypothetical protein